MTLKTKVNSVVSHIEKGKRKMWRGRKKGSLAHEAWISFLERESVFLISSFLNDPTVDSLRDKRENCSTWKGLRVDTIFEEF